MNTGTPRGSGPGERGGASLVDVVSPWSLRRASSSASPSTSPVHQNPYEMSYKSREECNG